MRDVRRIGGGRGLCRGPGKEWIGCFLDDLRAFGINTDQWATAAQDEGGMAHNGGTRGGTFHGEGDRCRESQGWTTAYTVVCPNVTGRTTERIAQSKRSRASSLALVD